MADYFNNRQNIIRVIILSVAAILLIRLFSLQIIEHDTFASNAQGQSISRQIIYPARGALIDRKGKMILNNILNYSLFFTPKLVDKNMDTAQLCKLLNITDSTFKETVRRALIKEPNKNKAILLFKDLSVQRVASLQEFLYNYSGFELQERTIRNSEYGCGGLVIGYTGEINEAMMKNDKYASYQKGDYLGFEGLENSYEEILRGQRGVKWIKRDNLNRPQGSFNDGKLDTTAIKGADLSLFLDIELQKYGEQLMKNKIGAVVAIEPKTGGILSMISAPTFDPNILNASDKFAQIYKMSQEATKPMFNRAVLGKYVPGSTFKPYTALAALDEGVITPSFGYPCHGRYSACGGKIKCTESWSGHAANLRIAMANSCNSYFMHLFRLTIDNPKSPNISAGLDRWHDYMMHFGFGHKTGVDLPYENKGNIPTSAVYNKMYNNNWNSCNACQDGMGQGEIELTPLQMANALCLIANRGYFYTPHFVKAIGGDSLHPLLKNYLVKNTPIHIPDSSIEAVQLGMEAVITNGTGKVAAIPGLRICGKTGTAENYGLINGKKTKLKNHSLFIAFAPKDNPKIAIAVIVENSGYGATWAGPIASLMIQKYLTDTIPPSRKGLERKMMTSNVIPSFVYLVDSSTKQRDRAVAAQKMYKKDSIAQFNQIKNNIIRQRDSLQVLQIFRKIYGNNIIHQ